MKFSARARGRHSMKIRNLRRCERNTLRGFFDLELPSGLLLRGCSLHFSHDRHWVGLPGRPYKDQDGRDTWANIVDFRDKATRDKFQQLATDAAVAAWRKQEAAA